jgi:1,2-diacylglycerol 3-beta-galactosyltransferase
LKQVIEQQRRPWQPRLLHLQDVLAPVDVFRKVLRIDLQEIYNQMLQRGWTFGSVQGLRFMQQVIRLFHGGQVKLLRQWFERDAPDMLVSVVPNFNRSIYQGFQAAAPGRPYVTILTDLADYPPRFWIEKQPQYFICGTGKAVDQAYAMGHPKERVFRTSGMILRPLFYETKPIDRAEERRRAGLDPGKPTAMVLFGGFGSMTMRAILEQLDRSDLDLQAIFVCGRNEKLRQALERHPARLPRLVVGFTNEIPRYMQLADFFIGKPGPGSVSEAVHLGLPVITVSNFMTLPQERYNAVWLEENEAGIPLRGYGDVADAVRRLLEGGRLERYRENCARLKNRAIFEVPELLEEIWRRHHA